MALLWRCPSAGGRRESTHCGRVCYQSLVRCLRSWNIRWHLQTPSQRPQWRAQMRPLTYRLGDRLGEPKDQESSVSWTYYLTSLSLSCPSFLREMLQESTEMMSVDDGRYCLLSHPVTQTFIKHLPCAITTVAVMNST